MISRFPVYCFAICLGGTIFSGTGMVVSAAKVPLSRSVLLSTSTGVGDIPPGPTSTHLQLSARGGSDVVGTATTAVTQEVSKSMVRGIGESLHEAVQDIVSGNFTWKETLFLVLAMASVGLAFSSMIKTDSTLVDILAWTCAIVGPSALILQRKLALMEGMRELTNQLREEVNAMSTSNAILQSQNRRLSNNSKKLKKTQSALEEISASQGISV